MYRIRKENAEFLRDIRNDSYARLLGMTPVNISYIFSGKTTKLSTAIGIISVRYNISSTDEKMQYLIEKHFEKIN